MRTHTHLDTVGSDRARGWKGTFYSAVDLILHFQLREFYSELSQAVRIPPFSTGVKSGGQHLGGLGRIHLVISHSLE